MNDKPVQNGTPHGDGYGFAWTTTTASPSQHAYV